MGADHIFGPEIRIRKDLGPMCFWSHGQLFSVKFYYKKGVVLSFPVVNLVRPRPPRPSLDPKPGVGGPKQGLERIYSLNRETRQKFYKTKVVGMVLVGADHIFGPVIWIWKDLDPMCFWSHGQSFSGKFYYTKGVVLLPSSQLGQA